MTSPTGENRDLQYPLDRSLVPETTTPDEAITNYPFTWQTTDNNERLTITLDLSLSEFIALSSAIDVGSDIAYGDDAIFVWWLWVRAVNSMTICTQVAECITNDAVTQQAIADAITNSSVIQSAIQTWMQNNGVTSPTNQINPNTTTVTDTAGGVLNSPILEIEDCDNDKLWGAIRHGLIEYLDDQALNWLQELNTIADKAQRANNLVSGIPIVGDLLSATINAFVEAIPDLNNLYVAYQSETAKDTAACELFQLHCDTCGMPTWAELISYFGNLGVTGMDDWDDLAFALATDLLIGSNTLGASVVWHTVICYELIVLYMGAKFNQVVGMNIINVWGEIGSNNGDNDWQLLCGGCTSQYCVFWDFTIDQQTWLPMFVASQCTTIYVAGVGFRGSGTAIADRTIAYKTFGQTVSVTTIEVEYSQLATPSVNWIVPDPPNTLPTDLDVGAGNRLTPTSVTDLGGGRRRATFAVNADKDAIEYHIQAGGSSNTYLFTIENVRMYYTSESELSLGGASC